jgi:hypothetical protein
MNKINAHIKFIWDNIISTIVLINAAILTGRKVKGLQDTPVSIINSSEMLRRIFGTAANSAAFTAANIIVLPNWENDVPTVVRTFVEYHEVAHVVLKHFVGGGMDIPAMLQYRNDQIDQGIILIEEVEADKYAALHTSVEESIEALVWLKDHWGRASGMELVEREIQARIDYIKIVGTSGMMLA